MLTFTGTSNNLSATFQTSLLVAPFGDFGLLPVAPVTVNQGQSAMFEASISVLLGGSSTYHVQFSASDLPSGVTAAFSPNPSPATDQSGHDSGVQVTLTAAPNAAPTNGTTITITGTRVEDGVQRSANVSLAVFVPPGTIPDDRTTYARTNGDPASVVYDPTHNMVFASVPLLNCVDAFSPATPQAVQCIPVPSPAGLSLSPDNSRLLVGTETNRVTWIDTVQLSVIERDAIPKTQGTATMLSAYVTPSQALQTPSGKYLLFSKPLFIDQTNVSTQAAAAFEWDPVMGTTIPRPDSGGGGMIASSVDHSVVVVGGTNGVDGPGSASLYLPATDSFVSIPFEGSPFILTPAVNPAGTQFALIGGSPNIQFFDAHANPVGSVNFPSNPASVVVTGAAYSADGHFLYLGGSGANVSLPLVFTVDATTFQFVGSAPDFNAGSSTYTQAADSTGLVFELAAHGVAITDAANLQTFAANVEPFQARSAMLAESPLQGGVTVSILGNFDPRGPAPDIVLGAQRVTNTGGSFPQFVSPPSNVVGLVDVKILVPTMVTAIIPQGFCYGAFPFQYGLIGLPPKGGADVYLEGFGFQNDDLMHIPVVTVGGTAAIAIRDGSSPTSTTPFTSLTPYPLQVAHFIAPAGSPGPVTVTVQSLAGTATFSNVHYLTSVTDYSSSDSFQYLLYDTRRSLLYLSAGDHVDVFNPATQSFAAPIPVPSLGATKKLSGLALTPDGSKLLVADQGDSSIAVVNPDSPGAGAVAVPLPGSTTYPFPIAATSLNTAFFELFTSTGLSSAAGLYELDLGSSVITQRSDLGGDGVAGPSSVFLRSSAAGDSVLFGGQGGGLYRWTATGDSWINHGNEYLDGAISGDGNVAVAVPVEAATPIFGSGAVGFFDSQLDITAIEARPDFAPAQSSTGVDFEQTGALLYSASAPIFAGTSQPPVTEVNLLDAQTGQLRESIILTQQMVNTQDHSVTLKSIAITPAGDQVFLATTAGITVVKLDSVPLGVGSVVPASGPAGTTVTIRGTGFSSGTTVTVNGAAAAVSFVDSSTLSVTVPASLPTGPARFVLRNSGGSSHTLDAAFTVH